MSLPSGFLSLPREIRDIIYAFYVIAEGGYTCNYDRLAGSILSQHERNANTPRRYVAGVLQRADLQPIDLNLSYTCRLVAREMRGVALKTNAITFSTMTSNELRIIALRFNHFMVKRFDGDRDGAFRFAGFAMPEIERQGLKLKYPQFAPLLDRMKQEGNTHPETRFTTGWDGLAQWYRTGGGRFRSRMGPYGEAPSLYRTFQKDALTAIASSKFGREQIERFWRETCPKSAHLIPALRVVECKIQHWAVPSAEDMRYLTLDQASNSRSRGTRLRDRTKYRFSAAAVAIHVLQSLPVSSRMHLRRVILNEDREAVADPQCHGLRLIPFCKENPLLRVERRKPGCAVQAQISIYTLGYGFGSGHAQRRQLGYRGLGPRARGHAFRVILATSGWPASALAMHASLPTDCPARCGLASSMASFSRPSLSWFDRKGELRGSRVPDLPSEKWPQALRDIAEGSSIVRCNFDVGDSWDVEKIVEDHRQWTVQQWMEGLGKREPSTWEPDAPLPNWREIVEENLVYVEPEDDVSSTDSDNETYSDEDDS
ncbi:unnamed protein product [Colletotrichum noveboracense]|uniref:Uncharacterized protein n=1 Tax=Colletotrichum noveboracense TaxID=2664923 RepID=A0A9W4S2K4_9PEZI|nr:unnamed protein product [Colletotrichum noveboracense]